MYFNERRLYQYYSPFTTLVNLYSCPWKIWCRKSSMILGFDASTTLSSGRWSIFELLVAGDPGMEDDVDIVNSVANKLSALLQIVRYATVTIFYFKCVPMSFFCNASKYRSRNSIDNKCFIFVLAVLSLACLMYR